MRTLIILCVALLVISCEDVIDVDLNTAAPRLVVDAFIELGENGTTRSSVKLTRTSGFFEEENPPVTDATVSIVIDGGETITYEHGSDGFYAPSTLFTVEENRTYTLIISDGSDTYTARETLEMTVPLTDVEQETRDIFGDEIVEITAFYTDPVGLGNAYLFEYIDENNKQVDVRDDEFSDGNRNPTVFFLEAEEAGTNARLSIAGIDQQTLTFYETLIQQTDTDGGGPFATQPATVRGNIVNTTDGERFPFGYFRVSQVFTLDYTIQ